MKSDLRFLRALLATNLKALLALRGAFWLAAVSMAANNLLYFAMWWIFFGYFDEVGGWRIGDMMILFGVVSSAFGATVVLAGGVRELGREISDGGLDAFMTQPKGLLTHLLGSKSFASGWGDLGSGVLFVALSGVVGYQNVFLVPVAVAISATVFVSTGVILQSLAFWLGRSETLSRMAWEFMMTFSLYPPTIFGGALRVMLFTLVPAGFIGFLPASLVRSFSLQGLIAALAGAVVYAVLASWVFRQGLRRYESGNRFGVRA